MDIAAAAEAVGVAFGIAGVWLTVRQNVWCWPVGLVNVALFAYVFFDARLYGSAALQIVYLILSVYGWYAWLHPGDGGRVLQVSATPRRWLAALAAAGTIAGVAFGVSLQARTDDALPFLDGATTSFSLVAQGMTARKWIENWLVWIAVDLVYVGMYLSQRLYLTAALYVAFLALAVLGHQQWRRTMADARRTVQP